ncbi:hypothetical protein F2Q70_00039076 [Brassica cretica]|uniref:Uncharacterized protein n=1 Tax=Brassica cretica TaxID=69181 RepID=A0A8S9KDE2_BRACR|nr:hypothetical protein F2Q70_00039076 [Brassica cretica]
MEVDRRLREELRLDSLNLRMKFWTMQYGKSQAHNAFIPKRFKDLKLNGGIRLRNIPSRLIYHKARLKKRKRRLMRENGKPSVTQKPEISTSSLRLGVKIVGMKKQYHQKKRIAQVKLAQACKSLGMFLHSPSFRDPKDCTKIYVVKRQIVDTGVKRETYLFRYGFTSLDPTDIDCRVDMWIGDHCLFAEEVKALKHDDPDAAVESLPDEAILVSESERTSKYKSQVELSHFQQQKEQQRFHKIGVHKTRKKELISLNIPVKALRRLGKESDGKNASGKPGRLSKKPPEPLWSFVDDSLKEMKLTRCSVFSKIANEDVWDPGQIKSCIELRQDSELKEKCQFFTLPVLSL